MKAFHPIPHFLAAVGLLLPLVAVAGPDDAPRTGRSATYSTTSRPAPPGVVLQGSTTTTETVDEDDRPIQPLRQREESVHFRIAYKLLNQVGFTGNEGDRLPVGYQQIYGPPPMLIYHRPPAPRPRRFPHFAADEVTHDTRAVKPEAKPATDADPAPDANPLPTASATPAAKTTPDDPDAGILPDAAQQAARSRNEEMLSYFRRSNPGNAPQNANRVSGNGPGPEDLGNPGYLQTPEQLPIPPSRATYRVVPK